jgi:hypothetical protein
LPKLKSASAPSTSTGWKAYDSSATGTCARACVRAPACVRARVCVRRAGAEGSKSGEAERRGADLDKACHGLFYGRVPRPQEGRADLVVQHDHTNRSSLLRAFVQASARVRTRVRGCG